MSQTRTGKQKEKRVKKKKPISENQACTIKISCGHPSPDGKMSVQMTYEGDPTLASYLLESAQGFIEHDDEGNASSYT